MRGAVLGALALALALGAAGGGAAPSRCHEPDYDEIAAKKSRPHCASLAERYSYKLKTLGERCLAVRGRAAHVRLAWGGDAARAAAAAVLALLRHALRYRRLRMAPAPRGAGALARYAAQLPRTELVVSMSTAWDGGPAPPWDPLSAAGAGGLAGGRLAEQGASWAPARCRLHARLPPAARARAACAAHTAWPFYGNASALRLCGFMSPDSDAARLYSTPDCAAAQVRLAPRAAASPARALLRMRDATRATLLRQLAANDHSFLFLDTDIWRGEPNVSVVQPPPCLLTDSDCEPAIDSVRAMRVADVENLQLFAPQLWQFVHDFHATSEVLRFILKREASGADIEDAACEWAMGDEQKNMLSNLSKYDFFYYWIAIFYCKDDPDNDDISKVGKVVGDAIYNMTKSSMYSVVLRRYLLQCSDEFAISTQIAELTGYQSVFGLLGVVSLGAPGHAATAASTAVVNRLPLLLAAPAAARGPAGAEPWRVAGSAAHAVLALRRFVRAAGWRRLAVLSERGELAEDYFDALQDDATLVSHQFNIPQELKETEVRKTLTHLQDARARIVFINANSETAVKILATALDLQMSHAEGYAWILRDWRPNNATSKMKHYTISFWSRGRNMTISKDGLPNLQKNLSVTFEGRLWPQQAEPLANALLSLAHGLDHVFRRYPDTRQDLHSANVTRSFDESLYRNPVTGFSQKLHYKERLIEKTFVFVDAWHGDKFDRLATWTVNVSAFGSEVIGRFTPPADLPSHDGGSSCLARSGDSFLPGCYDYVLIIVFVLLMLVLAGFLQARRVVYRRLRMLEKEHEARRKHMTVALARNLLQRDAIELREEIGAGQFGCVRLAVLRKPAQAPRYVAAKSLRENAAPAEESEFLREACIIGSLDHQHIVRLVGVCIADGPPLVLMELAFFGDLLGYLCARRHLVESAGLEQGTDETVVACEETAHVSAEALTRLAREAAAALAYLAQRGVVHRDVRAANCLVDARRSLKLADFGLARETAAAAPEYACRRRGLFPVLWMAPESLAHGVFSAASDVWALGVLVLELVTLGARPYGAMAPLRVLEFVAGGGRPPLPLDATPQTRGLARQCWQRAAERRPGAAQVQAYLAARPRALRPALLGARPAPPDADSGFGESPSTELLPSDSPLDSLGPLDV